ncbi:MAG: hypothetical protein MRZ79_04125 [Bacteroidia bacterium]|nr:hypothetical protein [Bacteroidia bacterium]
MFISHDSRGYCWIGSMQGPLRYNGIETRYLKDSLRDKIVTSEFLEDGQSNLWFSTDQAYYCYERMSDQLIPFTLVDEKGARIKEGYIVFHLQKRQGIIWLRAGKNGQIFKVDIEKPDKAIQTGISSKGRRFVVDTTSNGEISQLIASPWLDSHGFEIIKWGRGGEVRKEEFLLEEQFYITESFLVDDGIYWLLTTKGLYEYKSRSGDESLSCLYPNTFCFKGKKIDSLLYIATFQEGLWLFNTKSGKRIQKWEHKEAEPASIGQQIIGMSVDEEARIWTSHPSSAIAYSKPSIPRVSLEESIFRNKKSQVNFILEDSMKRIWLGTSLDGVYLLDLKGNLAEHFPPASFSDGLQTVQHLSMDKNGILWCLDREHIYRFDEKGFRWVKVYSSKSFQFYFLKHENNDSKLLVTNTGIKSLNFKKGKLSPVHSNSFVDYEGLNFLKIFSPFSNEDLLIPYSNTELWVCQKYRNDYKINSLELYSEVTAALGNDSGDKVWIGTSEGMLTLKGTETLQKFLSQEWELGNKRILGLQKDKSGKLWILTLDELFRYNPTDSSLRRFGKAEGLNSFTPAYLIDSENKIWLSQQDRLEIISLEDLKSYPHAPKPYLESLKINNSIFKEFGNIGERDKIELSHNQNSLEFRLVGIDFYAPDAVKIRYRLYPEGKGESEAPWILVNNGEDLQFNQLPSRKYVLELVAMNTNGVASKSKKLYITIKLPIYLRWWFILMCAAVLSALTWFTASFLERRRQQIIFKERKRIRGKVHAKLAVHMSKLNGELDELNEVSEPEKLKDKIGLTKALVSALDKSFRAAIWIMKHEKESSSLPNSLDFLRSTAEETLKNLQVKFKYNSSIPNVDLNGDYRWSLVLAFQEVINNIFVHSEATMVEIEVEVKEGFLIMGIRDNGKGFDPKNIVDKPGRGNGRRNIESEMQGLGGSVQYSSSSNGTQVILRSPLKGL